MLTLPPTSIRTWANYPTKRVLAKGLRPHQIVTGSGLSGSSPVAASPLAGHVQLVGVLPKTCSSMIPPTRGENIKRVTRGLGLTSEDYEINASGSTLEGRRRPCHGGATTSHCSDKRWDAREEAEDE